MSITASEARRRLFPLIESVNDNAEAVEIVSRAGSAYLVPDATTPARATEAAGAAADEPLLASLDIADKGHSAQHAGFVARLADAARARGITLEGAREIVFLIVPVDPAELPETQIEDLRFAPEGEGEGENGARDR